MAIEYSSENRFPFHTGDNTNVTICFGDHEDVCEMDFVWDKIVERCPELAAEQFYSKVQEIQDMKRGDKIGKLKDACAKLLMDIRALLSDEEFVHQLHDRYGIGVQQVI